jgi:hypothetical protein
MENKGLITYPLWTVSLLTTVILIESSGIWLVIFRFKCRSNVAMSFPRRETLTKNFTKEFAFAVASSQTTLYFVRPVS